MTQELTQEEALARLRTIVDEKIGMQPILGWEELLSLVEKKLHEDYRAIHDLSTVAERAHRYVYEQAPVEPLMHALGYAKGRGLLGWLKDEKS